jgi:predicted Na+-dependent transporter
MKDFMKYGIGIILTLACVVLFMWNFYYFIETVSKPKLDHAFYPLIILGEVILLFAIGLLIGFVWKKFFYFNETPKKVTKQKTKTKK